ncbi:hypothetical protein KYK31_00930 [Hymenobacter norwichensis]|nr:hypothetical protein [Hymenobacter norwichensis]
MQTGGYATAHPTLTPAEKALIYHYTDTGSTALNRALHTNLRGVPGVFQQELPVVLRKLPIYAGTVYSAAHLQPTELSRLVAAATTGDTLENAGIITWPAYLSASCSRRVAKIHAAGFSDSVAPKNCLFVVRSKTGRNIEQLSCYGPNGKDPFDSEQEVLFLPDTQFTVVGIDLATSLPIIQLIEV